MCALIRTFLSRVERFDVRELDSFRYTLATAREYRPDLIILDVDVPETECGEVAAQLRSDKSLSNVPLIFLSGLIGDEAVKRSAQWISVCLKVDPVECIVCTFSNGTCCVKRSKQSHLKDRFYAPSPAC